jgi:hypothetical protein
MSNQAGVHFDAFGNMIIDDNEAFLNYLVQRNNWLDKTTGKIKPEYQ